MKTCGISPKVLYTAIVGLASTLLLKLGIQWDPVVEQIVTVLAMILTGYAAPPGQVVPDFEGGNPVLPDAKP